MSTLVLRLLQRAHRASLSPARRRFARAMNAVEATQLARLRQLVSANAGTAYGRAHGFDRVDSVIDWQDRVPMVDYDDLQPWIAHAAAGEAGVLTAAPIRLFECTSGSTSANKLIPYTAGLLHEFGAATGPWLADLYASFPE